MQRALSLEGIDLPTLFMSGSSNPSLERSSESEASGVFLSKPFRQAELALAICRCMDAWHGRTQAAGTELRPG